MSDKTHLGTFIRECRNGLKYTSRQMARLSNGRSDIPSISNSYLISIENGKHIPRLDKIITLADLLKVPITHLVDRCRIDLGGQVDAPIDTDLEQLLGNQESVRLIADNNALIRCTLQPLKPECRFLQHRSLTYQRQ